MSYKMFLDDERMPITDDFVVVRSVSAAQEYIRQHGFPHYISFDNDLGENMQEGRHLAAWLVEQDLDHGILPVGFDFYVHSQNPIARQAIQGLLSSYLEHKNKGG
jgi:hypothetical protein